MGVETATFISELDATLPAFDDFVKESDDHLRLIKGVLKASFVNATYPVDLATFALLDTPVFTGDVKVQNQATKTFLYLDSTATGTYDIELQFQDNGVRQHRFRYDASAGDIANQLYGAAGVGIVNSIIQRRAGGMEFQSAVNSQLMTFTTQDVGGTLRTNMILGGATPNVDLYAGGVREAYTFFGGFRVENLLDVTGLVTLAAGTTTQAALRIPHGAAPTTPVNGDMWTTTAGLFVRINGVTVGPLA